MMNNRRRAFGIRPVTQIQGYGHCSFMVRPIVKYPEPVLQRPAAPVTEFDDELRALIDDMFESMYAAQGIGLAAPQIGVSKRITVLDLSFQKNP
jgi:peptide deformylase